MIMLLQKNDIYITPFVDNVVLNIRPDTLPNTYINFDNIGGIKGALKYIIVGPGTAVKYILRRIKESFKVKNDFPHLSGYLKSYSMKKWVSFKSLYF